MTDQDVQRSSVEIDASAGLPEAGEARQIESLIEQLTYVLDHMAEFDERFATPIQEVHPRFRASARNLVHYLSLRSVDLRDLQEHLARLGLSSLGRTEAHVMASLGAVLRMLGCVLHREEGAPAGAPVDFQESRQLLAAHTEALFGPTPAGRGVRIMVTLPEEAAENEALVRDLLAAGMDSARINCAHDEQVWARMIDHVRQASREVGRPCRILMDLAGSKLRTGPLEPGPYVLRWKPRRDARGRVVAPARIWLVPAGVPASPGMPSDGVLPVEEEWLARVRPGDRIRFRDARGKKRKLRVVARQGTGLLAEADQTAYVETGTILKLRPTSRGYGGGGGVTHVGQLPAVEQPIILKRGDTLVLYRAPVPGRPALPGKPGGVLAPARVSCTLPAVFADLQVGEAVKLDDGKIEGVIRSVADEEIHVEITQAKEGGSKLRADKSINFPESKLQLSGLTPKDLADLDFVARHADMVGLSFASSPEDIRLLQSELEKRAAGHLGIMLKIETQRGFQQLPWLLLEAMRSFPVGVMIARGDLAVECGWERMAEVQEEILWLCEAAHVPVIWATQVLEGLAQKGLPSRAEITDAAMAERAECVMLNKGPYIVKAIRVLDDVLRRMQGHQLKKMALLRSLKVSEVLAS